MEKIITNCLYCGNKNKTFKTKTCCKKCSDELKKKNGREKRYCVVCKSEFIIRKKSPKKLCSNECAIKWNVFPETIPKRKETCKATVKEKYGVDNVFKIPGFAEKMKKTKIERYGDENYNNQEKIKLTVFQKYGVSNVFQSPIIKAKIITTNREKFGVDHHLQLPEIMDK